MNFHFDYVFTFLMISAMLMLITPKYYYQNPSTTNTKQQYLNKNILENLIKTRELL